MRTNDIPILQGRNFVFRLYQPTTPHRTSDNPVREIDIPPGAETAADALAVPLDGARRAEQPGTAGRRKNPSVRAW
ncbi:MAG TPA: hypothetical protein VER17_01640 [Tepidisphaeraceae bacterium]|nr:hypothetical protein [Tepidisphaeraceae bacterium]